MNFSENSHYLSSAVTLSIKMLPYISKVNLNNPNFPMIFPREYRWTYHFETIRRTFVISCLLPKTIHAFACYKCFPDCFSNYLLFSISNICFILYFFTTNDIKLNIIYILNVISLKHSITINTRHNNLFYLYVIVSINL